MMTSKPFQVSPGPMGGGGGRGEGGGGGGSRGGGGEGTGEGEGEGGDGGNGHPAVMIGGVSTPSIVGNSRCVRRASSCAGLSTTLKTKRSCIWPSKRPPLGSVPQCERPTYRPERSTASGGGKLAVATTTPSR